MTYRHLVLIILFGLCLPLLALSCEDEFLADINKLRLAKSVKTYLGGGCSTKYSTIGSGYMDCGCLYQTTNAYKIGEVVDKILEADIKNITVVTPSKIEPFWIGQKIIFEIDDTTRLAFAFAMKGRFVSSKNSKYYEFDYNFSENFNRALAGWAYSLGDAATANSEITTIEYCQAERLKWVYQSGN